MGDEKERTAEWQLTTGSAGHPPTIALVVFREIGPGERAKRAGLAVLAGLVVSVLVIPIPIVHLVGIPLAVLGGLGAAVRLAGVRSTLRSVHGTCPRCEFQQSFFVGIGLFGYRLPMTLSCENCGRELRLTNPAA
jgi:hypothetical protein